MILRLRCGALYPFTTGDTGVSQRTRGNLFTDLASCECIGEGPVVADFFDFWRIRVWRFSRFGRCLLVGTVPPPPPPSIGIMGLAGNSLPIFGFKGLGGKIFINQ